MVYIFKPGTTELPTYIPLIFLCIHRWYICPIYWNEYFKHDGGHIFDCKKNTTQDIDYKLSDEKLSTYSNNKLKS